MSPSRPSAVREILHVLWVWIKGQILLWLTATVLYVIGFAIAQTPLWAALAVLCGIASAVPHFGGIIGLVLVLVFGFVGSSGDAMVLTKALAVWVLVQAIQGFVIEPRLLGRKLGLSSWIVLLGGIVGGFVAGPIGMLVATPVIAVAVVIWRRLRER
jgi:predicted PurR-regulated permease PerM